MSANGCVLASDVFAVCLTHALSTEREEVIGLLIGDVCRTLMYWTKSVFDLSNQLSNSSKNDLKLLHFWYQYSCTKIAIPTIFTDKHVKFL